MLAKYHPFHRDLAALINVQRRLSHQRGSAERNNNADAKETMQCLPANMEQSQLSIVSS